MEPNRKHNPEIEPEIRPRLRVIQGGGESTPERGNLSPAELHAAENKPRLRAIEGGGESTPERANLESVKNQEGNSFNYPGKGSTPKKSEKKSFWAKVRDPRKAIPSLLLTVILGGGIGLTSMIPSTMPINVIEMFTNDLNDSTSWNERNTLRVFGKKMGKDKAAVDRECAKGTKACELATFSRESIDRMESEDSKVKPIDKTDGIDGERVGVRGLRITSNTGQTVRVTSATQLTSALRNNIGIRSSFNGWYNAKNSSFFGQRFNKVLSSLGTSLAKKIKGDNKNEATESYRSAVTAASEGGEPITVASGDDDDETEKARSDKENTTKLSGDLQEYIDKGEKVQAGSVKLSGVMAGPQALCAAYQIGSVVSAGAKLQKAKRLAAFAMIFMTGAAAMKAGDTTAPEVETMMDTLAPSDYKEKVEDPETGEMIDNPYPPGANALDSEAYRIVAYGDEGDLNSIAGQFLVAGGATGFIGEIVDAINKSTYKEGVRGVCKIATNKFLNIGLTIASGIVGIGTALVMEAFSGQLDKLIASIINKAIEASAGADLTTDIKGPTAGNAIFAGASVILGKSAMSMAMKPGNKAEILQNVAMNNQVNSAYVAAEKYDAKDTPFDPNNQYSLVGSVLNSLRTGIDSSSQTSSLFGGLSLARASVASVGTTASANFSQPVGYDNDTTRFSKCSDESYGDIGIDADVFCNVRYVPFQEIDINAVLEYMKDYADPDTGEPLEEENSFDKFKRFCVDRQAGWGEQEGDDSSDWGTGKNCIQGNEKQNAYFANYIALLAVQDDMDSDPTDGDASGGLAAGASLRVGTFNLKGAAHTGKQGPDGWLARIKLSEKAVEDNKVDVVGFQEFEPPQRDYMRKNLQGYSISRHGKESDSIAWNSEKFTKVDQGTWRTEYFGVSSIQEPWVKLRSKETKQELYFMNVHDPINRGGKNATNAGSRYRNAMKHLAEIKRLQTKAPVILVGDFNSGFNRSTGSGATSYNTLAYCMFIKNGTLRNAYNVAKKRAEKCPLNAPRSEGFIDHIYVSKGLEVPGFKKTKSGFQSNGSDHPLMIADIVIPGAESSGGGVGSNVKGDDYAKECGRYRSKGVNCGGQCVDFVKFRLIKNGAFNGGSLGDGKFVVGNLGRLGYKVDRIPAVNSVFSTSQTSTPQWGHAGMVSAVNPDGSIVVEEYNFGNPLKYGSRTVSKKEYLAKGYTFAHTETKYR